MALDATKSTVMAWRRENGRVGVRNYVVILPLDDISNAACEAVRVYRRAVKGVIGPWSLAVDVLVALDLTPGPAARSREVLYRLVLDELVVPPGLDQGEVR